MGLIFSLIKITHDKLFANTQNQGTNKSSQHFLLFIYASTSEMLFETHFFLPVSILSCTEVTDSLSLTHLSLGQMYKSRLISCRAVQIYCYSKADKSMQLPLQQIRKNIGCKRIHLEDGRAFWKQKHLVAREWSLMLLFYFTLNS